MVFRKLDTDKLNPEEFLAHEEARNSFELRKTVTLVLLFSFVGAMLVTLTLISLSGLGIVSFPEGFLKWMGGATISEVAGLIAITLKSR